jgi:hypothetical protein
LWIVVRPVFVARLKDRSGSFGGALPSVARLLSNHGRRQGAPGAIHPATTTRYIRAT